MAMIVESINQLDQLLQDVQERRSVRDQWDEFQGNDDQVAFECNLGRMVFINILKLSTV